MSDVTSAPVVLTAQHDSRSWARVPARYSRQSKDSLESRPSPDRDVDLATARVSPLTRLAIRQNRKPCRYARRMRHRVSLRQHKYDRGPADYRISRTTQSSFPRRTFA